MKRRIENSADSLAKRIPEKAGGTILLEILEAANKGLALRKRADPTDAAYSSNMAEISDQAMILLLELKQEHRNLHLDAESSKRPTEDSERFVSDTEMLQILSSFCHHAETVIDKTDALWSPDPSLLTTEEFARIFPDEQLEEHPLRLKLLEYELSRRKAQRQELDLCLQKLKKSNSLIQDKHKLLDSMPRIISGLSKATSPVEENLGSFFLTQGLHYSASISRQVAAESLPSRMFLLYKNVSRVQQHLALLKQEVFFTLSITTIDEKKTNPDSIYAQSNQSFALSFKNDTTTLRFAFLPQLELLCCTGVEAKLFLNLVQGDDGTQTLLPDGSAFSTAIGRPYRWLQDLANPTTPSEQYVC